MPLRHSKYIYLLKYGYFKDHRLACHGAFGKRDTLREQEQEIGLKEKNIVDVKPIEQRSGLDKP